MIFPKILVCPKIFGPLKWYTDRNFFGDGGGGVVQNNFLRKKFFATKGTNNLQVFNHLNLAALPLLHSFCSAPPEIESQLRAWLEYKEYFTSLTCGEFQRVQEIFKFFSIRNTECLAKR